MHVHAPFIGKMKNADDVFRIALKRGLARVQSTVLDEQIVGLMIGKGLGDRYPKTKVPIGEAVMQVVDLTMGQSLKNVSFSLRRGEILGVYGLMGAGQADLPRAIFGLSSDDPCRRRTGRT